MPPGPPGIRLQPMAVAQEQQGLEPLGEGQGGVEADEFFLGQNRCQMCQFLVATPLKFENITRSPFFEIMLTVFHFDGFPVLNPKWSTI